MLPNRISTIAIQQFAFNNFFSINFCVNESNILRQKKYHWWFKYFEYRKPSGFANFCLVIIYYEQPTLSYMTKKTLFLVA